MTFLILDFNTLPLMKIKPYETYQYYFVIKFMSTLLISTKEITDELKAFLGIF